MIPDSLVGLVFFLALLAPGFVYLERRERFHPGIKYSALRETSIVAVTSLGAVATSLALLGLARWIWPDDTPDVGAYARRGADHAEEHYLEAAVWGVVLLGVACLLAAIAARPPAWAANVGGEKWRRWISRRRGSDVPIRQESGWRVAFAMRPKSVKMVTVVLTDGTTIFGRLGSQPSQIDENNDRDLLLTSPLQIRHAGGDWTPQPLTGVVVVSAGRIQYFSVQFEAAPVS